MGEPSARSVGGLQLSVAVPAWAVCGTTTTAKVGRLALAMPSLTVMRMPLQVSTSPSCGVPRIRPVDESRLIHGGRLSAVTVSASPSGSEMLGWKDHWRPTVALVGGVPLMVGGLLPPPPPEAESPPKQPARPTQAKAASGQAGLKVFIFWFMAGGANPQEFDVGCRKIRALVAGDVKSNNWY